MKVLLSVYRTLHDHACHHWNATIDSCPNVCDYSTFKLLSFKEQCEIFNIHHINRYYQISEESDI